MPPAADAAKSAREACTGCERICAGRMPASSAGGLGEGAGARAWASGGWSSSVTGGRTATRTSSLRTASGGAESAGMRGATSGCGAKADTAGGAGAGQEPSIIGDAGFVMDRCSSDTVWTDGPLRAYASPTALTAAAVLSVRSACTGTPPSAILTTSGAQQRRRSSATGLIEANGRQYRLGCPLSCMEEARGCKLGRCPMP
mmetsp:Transcript_81213/g.215562  ORF Transcript_81213/g.215562 Transcript_81213/m.215562 type:complete len:201 (+) Transcript_81213:1136-1738(+)